MARIRIRWSTLREHAVDGTMNMRALAGACILATVLFGLLSWSSRSSWWQGIFADLSITALSILITVFLIDRIVDRHEQLRWAGVRSLANNDLRVAAARVMVLASRKDPDTQRAERFQYGFIHNRTDRLGHWKAFLERDGWRSYVEDALAGDVERILPGDFDSVKEFLLPVVERLNHDLDDILRRFGMVLSPEQITIAADVKDTLVLVQIQTNWEFGTEELRQYFSNLLKEMIVLVDSTQ